jgi:hypothetical protein
VKKFRDLDGSSVNMKRRVETILSGPHGRKQGKVFLVLMIEVCGPFLADGHKWRYSIPTDFMRRVLLEYNQVESKISWWERYSKMAYNLKSE